MRLHHIGICCKNIEKEIKNIQKLHKLKNISDIVYDAKQDASLCMIELENGEKLELISGKQVENIVKNRINYYHICYEVDDIEEEMEKLQKKGAFLLSHLKEAILFNNKRVCFFKVSYGVIELVEK